SESESGLIGIGTEVADTRQKMRAGLLSDVSIDIETWFCIGVRPTPLAKIMPRAAAPLVGAGLDRIAHAWFTEKCDSLELAARAEIRLATVGGSSGYSPLDLLESP